MWQRRDLLQDELYGKGPEKKGRRPCVPTFTRLFGLARNERDTSDAYAPLRLPVAG